MIGFCQSQSHYGHEFYFGMPHNKPTLCMELTLDIASLNAGNYSLRVPFLNMLDHGVIHKGLTNISIPCSLTKGGTFKENRGIFLKTNVFVAVYATNYYKATAETFLVLPLEELGKNYCTAAYIPDSVEESYILVTAASNGTNVSIFNNSISKVIHNSSLNKLDLQQFSSTDDLQGVTVESDGPVSVVTGTSCTEIPQGFAACDVITEQMIPTDSFESVYIVPPTPPKQAHELRVTHVQNAINKTVCFYNMTRSFCRNDSTISVRMGSDPTVIVSSSPVGVFQYGYGNKYPLASIGDPFMTIIPGLGQFLNCYYFAIPSVYSNAQNHISIIIQNASLPGLSLDNKSLLVGTKFRVASPLQNYTVLNLNVSYGYHLVQHNDSNVKFGLLVYGLGEKTDTYVGYGYPGGMRLSNIASTTKITPADTAKANTTTTSTTTSQNKSGLTSTDNQSSMGDKNTGKQGIDPLGSILGAVLGTAAAISLLACILYLFLWKKRGRKGKSSVEPER